MNLNTISVTIHRTFNLGNFENIKIEVSYEGSLTDGEDPEDARSKLSKLCRDGIRAVYKEAKKDGL